MGNLCGKEEASSSTPVGRVLGSTPASATHARVPATASPNAKNPKKPKVTGAGRTLGSSVSGPSGGSGDQSAPAPADARAAAALAAEQRLNNSQKSGKLATQLDQVKRKTQNQHIQDLAKSKGEQERLVWD